MKNVLITGSSGWLGVNLINTFLKGIDLYPETHNLSENTSINVFIPRSEYEKIFSLFGDKIKSRISTISLCVNGKKRL